MTLQAEPEPTPTTETDLDALEALLGYTFQDRSRLVTAITHRSFAHEAPDNCRDNEPLEFLGDAILSFVIAERLYREFPGLDEGRLSKHKSVLEKSSSLADASRRMGLGRFLLLGRGERKSGGSSNEKILSDAYEALVAAIYLDGGLAAVGAFVERSLGGKMGELDRANPITDFKSALQEATQGLGLGTPVYRVIEEVGPDHDKEFRVMVGIDGHDVAEGGGSTKRGAHQIAAARALELLRSGWLPPRHAGGVAGEGESTVPKADGPLSDDSPPAY